MTRVGRSDGTEAPMVPIVGDSARTEMRQVIVRGVFLSPMTVVYGDFRREVAMSKGRDHWFVWGIILSVLAGLLLRAILSLGVTWLVSVLLMTLPWPPNWATSGVFLGVLAAILVVERIVESRVRGTLRAAAEGGRVLEEDKEIEWVNTHLFELGQKFADQWIAVKKDQVVAHAASPQELMQQIGNLHVERLFITEIPGQPIVWNTAYAQSKI